MISLYLIAQIISENEDGDAERRREGNGWRTGILEFVRHRNTSVRRAFQLQQFAKLSRAIVADDRSCKRGKLLADLNGCKS
jgi:hypothetical protein